VRRKNPKCTMTLTPPLGDEELARSLPDWLLGGQRVAALRTDGRTPLGCRADAGKMSRGRTSRRMSHRRSDERIRFEALVAHSTVECSQTRRDGRSFRAPSPRLRRCQGVSMARCCPWLCAARHRQPRATGNRRSIARRMGGRNVGVRAWPRREQGGRVEVNGERLLRVGAVEARVGEGVLCFSHG
jgi:hypothetical protein